LVIDLEKLAAILKTSKDKICEIEFSAILKGTMPKVNDPYIMLVSVV